MTGKARKGWRGWLARLKPRDRWELTLLVTSIAVPGFLLLQGMWRRALIVLSASLGGWFLNAALKQLYQRPRPAVVPHLREAMSLSFPSGHALQSAAVYLTLGALMMRLAHQRITKVYCMVVAA